jgi:hypothetical protein
VICSLGTALPLLAPCAADLTPFLPIAQRKIPDLRVSRRVPCLCARLPCSFRRVVGLPRRVLCLVGCVLRLVGCILPYQIPAIALVVRVLPEQILAKRLQLRKFCFIRRVGEGMQREFDTVGRILPKQIPVRKGLQPEIKSVGCILPCMFLVGEDEIVAFHSFVRRYLIR